MVNLVIYQMNSSLRIDACTSCISIFISIFYVENICLKHLFSFFLTIGSATSY